MKTFNLNFHLVAFSTVLLSTGYKGLLSLKHLLRRIEHKALDPQVQAWYIECGYGEAPKLC